MNIKDILKGNFVLTDTLLEKAFKENKIERSPISGFPMTWIKLYSEDGEYDCTKCKHEGDQDYCAECYDYGTSFYPKNELIEKGE